MAAIRPGSSSAIVPGFPLDISSLSGGRVPRLAAEVSLERDGKCHFRAPRLVRSDPCDLTDGDFGVALKQCLRDLARLISGSIAAKLSIGTAAAISQRSDLFG